jgi:hypothetical protein
LTPLVSAIAVPAFALTWWLACYLLGRDPARAALWRAAGALAVYAVAVAAWAIDPGSTVAQVLLCVPALLWAGAAVALLPDGRAMLTRGWVAISAVFLVVVILLPGSGRLVALVPLAGALVLLWRSRAEVRPALLPLAVTIVAGLYALGLVAVLGPVDLGSAGLVLAAIGLDLMVLGYLVAVADAVDAGERLHPDLRRSAVAAAATTLLIGGPAALTTLAAPDNTAVTALQFVVVGFAMTMTGLPGVVRRGLDRLAYLNDDRIRADRAALLLSADALPRRRERHRLLSTSQDEFARLTRRALEDFRDPVRLLRSPLINLPTVDRRLTGQMAEQPLARALELRAVLQENVARLKPDGLSGTSEEWRHYNALHFVCVLGLRPYARQQADGLDRDARLVVDWFRRAVPQPMLRQWQDEGARRVADRLWGELVRTDPRWLTHARTVKRTSTTRSS